MSILIETLKNFKAGDERVFRAGETIFKDGEKGAGMYGILAGDVAIEVAGNVIETLSAGNVFGIGAIVHQDHLHTSTAIAKTDCTLAYMDREHFFFAVQQSPVFALQIMQRYSDRFRRLKDVWVEHL